jgi:hypothetical protein
MMVLGLVTTSAVCFMLLVRDHPYSAAIFGLLAVLPIAYFFKTYAGPAFPLHFQRSNALTFETCQNACALCCVRWCVCYVRVRPYYTPTVSRRSCLRPSSARWCR